MANTARMRVPAAVRSAMPKKVTGAGYGSAKHPEMQSPELSSAKALQRWQEQNDPARRR